MATRKMLYTNCPHSSAPQLVLSLGGLTPDHPPPPPSLCAVGSEYAAGQQVHEGEA